MEGGGRRRERERRAREREREREREKREKDRGDGMGTTTTTCFSWDLKLCTFAVGSTRAHPVYPRALRANYNKMVAYRFAIEELFILSQMVISLLRFLLSENGIHVSIENDCEGLRRTAKHCEELQSNAKSYKELQSTVQSLKIVISTAN